MHQSNVTAPLVSSFRTVASSWQSALKLFRRSLIEAGSPMEVEHSQRLGILFSKDVGRSNELQMWAALFSCEDVPTCSMMLKALVKHGQWKSAMRLFEWSYDSPAMGQLGEHLAQFMLAQGLQTESLAIVQRLATSTEGKHDLVPEDTTDVSCVRCPAVGDSLVKKALDDTVGLSKNPTYVPDEEQDCYCGLGRAVFRAFPKSSQWEESCDLLRLIGTQVTGVTRQRLMEYEYARRVYVGKQYDEARRSLASSPYTKSSTSLSRTLFYAALALEDLPLCFGCLDVLNNATNAAFPAHTFTSFCDWFIKYHVNKLATPQDERHFLQLVAANSHKILSSRVRASVTSLFAAHDATTASLSTTTIAADSHFVAAERESGSIKDDDQQKAIEKYDELASVFMGQGKWKEALLVLNKLVSTKPRSDRDKVIHETVLRNCGDWEKALLFLS